MRAARLASALPLLLALAACSGGGGAGAAPVPFEIARRSTLSKIIERGKLVVGQERKFWPFEYEDAAGRPVGLDVDLARELAKELGVELELRDIEWSGLIASLLDGKVDIIVSGMTATLERARTIAFSEPYHRAGLCLLVRKESRIGGARDLDDPALTLALKLGTTGHLVALRDFPRAQKKLFKDEGACALEVAQGRADAFIYDQISIAKHAKEHPDTTRAILEPFTYEPYAIALRQGEPDLARFLDQFLRTIAEDGRLDAIKRKHLAPVLGEGAPAGQRPR
jgi:polar amino acid transport system substrate-binding protein